MQNVDPPEVPRGNEIVWLTTEELERLIEAFEGTPYYVPVALGARTGLRRDEVLALSFGDIDDEAGVVRVRRILEDVAAGDAPRFTEPKSPIAREPIHLDETARKLLREHVTRRQADLAKSGAGAASDQLVFARADGSPFILGEFEKAFLDVATRAGFPRLRFHHLRDTLAIHLVQAGEPVSAVAERMRHQDQASTSRRYFAASGT